MKTYWLKFGSVSASSYTGLFPTMTIFNSLGITALAAPGITEIPAASGLYRFQYDPTTSIAFQCDGGATLTNSIRYIVGSIDPNDKVDEDITSLGSSVSAIGQTLLGLGSTVISFNEFLGTTASSFGSTAIDPVTVFGAVKRLQEILEGNATFSKTTGTWNIYSRGASTLLRVKTLTDGQTSTSKN
jgi:hypothetical protein